LYPKLFLKKKQKNPFLKYSKIEVEHKNSKLSVVKKSD
jgi:ubiquitin